MIPISEFQVGFRLLGLKAMVIPYSKLREPHRTSSSHLFCEVLLELVVIVAEPKPWMTDFSIHYTDWRFVLLLPPSKIYPP